MDLLYVLVYNIEMVKSVKVKVHEYLSMTLDYTTKEELKIDT